MKKILLISIVSLSLLCLTACTDKIETQPKEEQKENDEKEVTQITPEGGLGDTLKVFEQNYGPNSGNNDLASFKNDYIQPSFWEGKADSFYFMLIRTDKANWTKEQVLNEMKKVIPNDAVKVKEYFYRENPQMEVIEYTSESLKNVFDDLYEPEEPGNFNILLYKEEDIFISASAHVGKPPEE